MSNKFLYISDAIGIALVTFAGYVFHDSLEWSVLPRFFLVFIPLALGWFLLAPWFGLFQPEIVSNPKQLWRPALAMLFAAPPDGLAAVLGSQDSDDTVAVMNGHVAGDDGAGDDPAFGP